MSKTKKEKKGGILSKLLKVGIVLLVALVALGAFYHKEIKRLKNVITLFDEGVIIENFRSMDTIIDYKVVHKGDTTFEFGKDEMALPKTYEYKGETKDIAEFLEGTWTTGLIVIKDDKIAFEEYYLGNTEESKAISWSVAKSFVSALVGIAIDEGHIKDISDPVTDYVPMLKGTGYDNVSIKDVLQMSSGVRFNEDYFDFFSDINRMGRVIALNLSLDNFVASLEPEREPGTYNHYVSMDTQVLGMVLREATGQDLSSYLEEKIWKKIGMESDAYFLTDGKGMELAFGGLNVVLRDYARYGRLYLNDGNWNGDVIVPADWVKASVTPDAPHLMPGENPASDWVLGYGYQWWLPENPEGDFLGIGVYHQFLYVHPDLNVVIAKTSAYAHYDVDGFEKELETIAVFRAIVKGLSK
jgi:CubicO group peptidase (beta-lactamase class C family)